LILDLSKDGKFAVVSAFKTPATVDPSQIFKGLRTAVPDVDVQFFDGRRIAGKEHLEIAAINALHAFKAGTNISRSVVMEVLLYASAQRQIDVAITRLGVTRDSKTVAFVGLSDTRDRVDTLEDRIAQLVGIKMNDMLLDEWSDEKMAEIMKLYEIEAVELETIKMPGHETKEAVKKAVTERVALLSTRT
jgi:tRNA threonylcarbamoyladenosine modification (KEOPS) complex Cgi121 subunit